MLVPNANEFFGRCDLTNSGYGGSGPVPIVIADNTFVGSMLSRGGDIPVATGSEYFLQYPSPCGVVGCSHSLDALSLPLVVPAYIGMQHVASLRVTTRLYVPALTATGFSAMSAHQTTIFLSGAVVAVGSTPFLPVHLNTGFVASSSAAAGYGCLLGITFTLLASDGSVIAADGSSDTAVIRWRYSVPVLVGLAELAPVLLTALPGSAGASAGSAFLPGLRLTATVDESGVGSTAQKVWTSACSPGEVISARRRLNPDTFSRARAELMSAVHSRRRLQSSSGPAPLDCPLARTDLQSPFPLVDNVAGGRMLTNRLIPLGNPASPSVDILLVFPASCTRCNVYLKEAVLPLARSLGCPVQASFTATLGVWAPGFVSQQTVYTSSSFSALRNGFTPRTTATVDLAADVSMMSLNLAATTGDNIDAGASKVSLPSDAYGGSMLALRVQATGCLGLGVGQAPASGTTFGSYSATGADVVDHPVSVSAVNLLLSTGFGWKPLAELPGLYVPTVLVEPWEPTCGTGSTPYDPTVNGNSLPTPTKSPARSPGSTGGNSLPSPAPGTGSNTGTTSDSSSSSSQSGLLGAVGAGGVAGIAVGAAVAAALLVVAGVVVTRRLRTSGDASAQPAGAAAAAGGNQAPPLAITRAAAPAGVAPRRSPVAGESAAPVTALPAAAAAVNAPAAVQTSGPAAEQGSSTGVQRVLSPAARLRRGGGADPNVVTSP
jgi:hypothetical protein